MNDVNVSINFKLLLRVYKRLKNHKDKSDYRGDKWQSEELARDVKEIEMILGNHDGALG